jgi:RNA polymerase sigma-70 factor (ECF subfamily)
MRRVRASDEAAFAALMARWERPVKAVIARLVLNAGEAEELAQETFVRVWQHRDRFEPGRAVKPWILGIAVNLARNRLRWWRRRPTVSLDAWTDAQDGPGAIPAGTPTADDALETAERAAAVRDAIAALPLPLREALVLFEYEDLSHQEIALAVGATPKAVETRIARARASLRTSLRRWL